MYDKNDLSRAIENIVDVDDVKRIRQWKKVRKKSGTSERTSHLKQKRSGCWGRGNKNEMEHMKGICDFMADDITRCSTLSRPGIERRKVLMPSVKRKCQQ